MDYTGKFKLEMQKSVLRKIISLLIKVSIFFVGSLLIAVFFKNERAASQNMKQIKEVFIEAYESNRSFLLEERSLELFNGVIAGTRSDDELQNALNRYNLNKKIRSEVIITDAEWNIEYTSYHTDEISAYLYSYNNAVSYNARMIRDDEVYTAVYNDQDGYYDYMMVKPIHGDKGEIVGYISMFLSGDDWSYYMSYYNYDAVLTDNRDNIIFYNKPNLIANQYKFNFKKQKITEIGGERYWVKSELLKEYGINVYSFILYPPNLEIVIGLFVIIIIGILWYNLAVKMSETMAEKNAQSISQLVGEIRIIRKYNQNHRINMNTKDEFEDVGHHINHMLDTIIELNDKNTELLKLNSTIEINHLTAQINPHFLYNTLEIIRNLVIFDKEKAGDLILKLTQVLRYSINNSKRDVMLKEDMEFIKDYLSIQESRFGERLRCRIEISEECTSCTVPKLILQPIIENSIKHGFKAQMEMVIEIRGHVEEDMLHLTVQDNGPGMSKENIEDLKTMLGSKVNDTRSNGLFNIARRLKLQYTESSGIEIESTEKGLRVHLRIKQPKEKLHLSVDNQEG